MNSNPIVRFELSRGPADASLIQLAEARPGRLSEREAHEVYVRMHKAAEQGSPFAMCMCSTWRDVHGRTELSAEGRYQWARRAAEAGYAPGIYQLAYYLQNGIGVPKDLVRAQELYEHAAAAGFGFAAYRLGMALADGALGRVDVQRALHFMERAYELGEASGALALADWFESGVQVKRDLTTALRWYERASRLGDFTASHRLQLAYMLGELGVARDADVAKHYERLVFAQTEPPSR